MRTNNIEDVIVSQIIQEVLEEASDIRVERKKTYNNSFVECYDNYGIDYILGEVFNCSKRLQLLRKSEGNPDWKKIKDVSSDLINWAVLTAVCLRLEDKERTGTAISEGVVKDPVNEKDKNVCTVRGKVDVDTSELEEITTVINSLKNIKKDNPEYYDYLMGILKFGPPKNLASLQDIYCKLFYESDRIKFCMNTTNKYLPEKWLFLKKYFLLKKKYIYYIDEEGRIYE